MSLLEIYLDSKPDGGNVFVKSCFTKYFEYLRSVESRLPASARQFAMAPWHYDQQDHRCPHDSWLEALTISEPSSGVRCEIRSINILIRLLGAYHDGYLELRYENVQHYSVAGERTLHGVSGHGDWLIDEITVADSGSVVHEFCLGVSIGGKLKARRSWPIGKAPKGPSLCPA
jgi:hypothetical protein